MPGRDRTITVILSIPFVKKFQQLTNTCIYYNWGQNVCSNLVRLCGVCTTTKPKWRHYFMQVTVRWRHCCVTADWCPAFFRSFCSTWFVCLRSEENSAPDSAIITWLHLKKSLYFIFQCKTVKRGQEDWCVYSEQWRRLSAGTLVYALRSLRYKILCCMPEYRLRWILSLSRSITECKRHISVE
jgi:hypothetical protein